MSNRVARLIETVRKICVGYQQVGIGHGRGGGQACKTNDDFKFKFFKKKKKKKGGKTVIYRNNQEKS